jgi:hypothetical protein
MSNGTQVDVTNSAEWSLDGSASVSVSTKGMVIARSKGVLKVTAAYSGISGTASSTIVAQVLLDTLNDDLQNLDGEPSFRRGWGTGNEAFDDFVSPITTSPNRVTFQGIRCGSERRWIFGRFYRTAGDLPDRSNYIEFYWQESDIIRTIDGVAPRACPGGSDGTLVTYVTYVIGYTVTAGERNWVSIFAYLDDPDWTLPDQWQLRHGKAGNGYAAAYRTSGNFVRQTRDFAVRLE